MPNGPVLTIATRLQIAVLSLGMVPWMLLLVATTLPKMARMWTGREVMEWRGIE